MFFAEKEENNFPEKIRKEICDLESKDREIYRFYKQRKSIDLEVINFFIKSLKLFLNCEKSLNNEQKNLMAEAVGSVYLTFFVLDKLKVDKRVQEATKPLLDMVDAHANLSIDRRKLSLTVLKKLYELKKYNKKDEKTQNRRHLQ